MLEIKKDTVKFVVLKLEIFYFIQLKHFFKRIKFEIKIGETVVKIVKSDKYLGVIINNNLSWAKHIEMLKSKLLKANGFFNKTRYFLNEKPLFLIFNSLV